MLYETVLDRSTYQLLKEYCTLPFLSNFSLAGGTALALRLGHRISYDIDLFSNENFDVQVLDREVDSYLGLDYIKRVTSPTLYSQQLNQSKQILFLITAQ